MLHSKTVFVLGAGSSHEVGLPLGYNLAARIGELVNFRFEDGNTMVSGDRELYGVIKQKFGASANEYRRAGAFIASGVQLANSIDDFLSLHQSDEKITFTSKLGIVKAILAAEKKSALCPRGLPGEEIINFDKLSDTWFAKFLKMVSREVPKEDVNAIFENISFVNFNYDRCIEFFLSRGLQKLYGIDDRHAADIVAKMKIYHPYGSVGSLPMVRHDRGIPFAADDVDYSAAAARIKTYSEKIEERSDLDEMRGELSKAKLIVFLGIHFHEQNIRLIAPKRASAENVFATALGFSDEDRSVVEDQLRVFLAKKYRDGTFLGGPHPIRVQDLTCSQLFDRYSKTLPRPNTIEPMDFPKPFP